MAHCGYKLKMYDDNIQEKLQEYMGELINDLRFEIFTAILFKQSKAVLEDWYKKRLSRTTTGYLYKIYVDVKGKIAVAEIQIDGTNHYITLVHAKSNIPLIQIKKMVNMGQLGSGTMLKDKIPVECVPYLDLLEKK